MSMKGIKKYLSPVLQKATDEELSLIGVAAFGSNTSYVKSEHPNIYQEFMRTFKVTDDKPFDRKMLHYIMTQAEPTKRMATTSSGAKFTMNPKPKLSDIVEKAKEYKQ